MLSRGSALFVLAALLANVSLAQADASAAPNKAAKAPPAPASLIKVVKATTSPTPAPPIGLVIVETSKDPALDYEAEVYSGVPLDDAYARDRGLSKGLVRLVFEKQRRTSFRIAHDKIKRVVRLAEADATEISVKQRGPFTPLLATRNIPRDRVDVIETGAGYVAIETFTTNAGIFTTSEVYVFAKGATLEQRLAAIAATDVGQASRERLRTALTLAK